MKYLLIDDNPIDLLVNGKVVENLDQKALIVQKQSASEALSYLREEKPELDIILLDIKMPLMDGFAFLEEYKAIKPLLPSVIHVFMVSSSIDPQDVNRSNENPEVSGFLEKPLNIDALKRDFVRINRL